MPDPVFTKLSALDMNEPLSGNVRRLFPRRDLTQLDPFARLEEQFMRPPAGLPPHEHRGFEGVTYVLAGALQHGDALMSELTAPAGGILRFTAGRGLFHGERPATEDPREQTRVLQLWVALARADKDHPPTAEQIPPDQVPVTHAEGVTRRVVLGPGAPLSLHTEVGWLDLAFTKRRVRHSEPIPAEHRGLVYLLDGTLEAQGIRLAPADALLFEHLDSLELRARKGARAALIHGRPHREPIRPWGLVVD
jgi:hypothetical protein